MAYSNIAAVVVHMQNEFLSDIDPEKGKAMYKSQMEILNLFADQNLPICTIEIVQSFERICYGVTIPEISDIAKRSSNYANIKAEKSDAFEFGNATKVLSDFNVNTLLMMGVYGSYCVTHNARGAKETGKFKVMGSTDLMIDPIFQERGFPWFKTNDALVDYKEILKELKS